MFKKLMTVIFAVCVITGLAHADTDKDTNYTPTAQKLGGFYVGIGIIRDVAKIQHIADLAGSNGAMDGTSGELLLGFAWMWNNFIYTGAEIFGQVSSNRGQFIGFDRKQEGNYGIRVMPGLKIANSTILFGNVGFVRTRYVSGGPANFIGVGNHNGLQLGLGLETMINSNMSLRGGWNWNRFAPTAFNSRVLNNQFYLDVIYHFTA